MTRITCALYLASILSIGACASRTGPTTAETQARAHWAKQPTQADRSESFAYCMWFLENYERITPDLMPERQAEYDRRLPDLDRSQLSVLGRYTEAKLSALNRAAVDQKYSECLR